MFPDCGGTYIFNKKKIQKMTYLKKDGRQAEGEKIV